jgi:two-component system NarL family sensor kinase
MPQMVYMNFGFLLWLAVATTALCFVLARRAARVTALMDVRRRLVSEAAEADDRHNRELAEHLHDGPLQILLAARLELDEVRDRHPDPALDVLQTALHEAAAGLRSTVSELHPQVLAQLGLTPAIQELVRQYEIRGGCVIEAQLEDVGRPSSQSLLYRAARELLANTLKHARQPSSTSRCSARATPSSCGLPTTAPVSIPRSSTAASPKGISAWHPCWSASTRWAVRWTSAPRLDSERR